MFPGKWFNLKPTEEKSTLKYLSLPSPGTIFFLYYYFGFLTKLRTLNFNIPVLNTKCVFLSAGQELGKYISFHILKMQNLHS